MNLRFKNPIQGTPIDKHERVYGTLSQWHLMGLREADPRMCAELFLESSVYKGFVRREVAAYAITPNAVGGCGIDPNSPMGVVFAHESDGRWYTAEVSKEMRPLGIGFGCWERRLREVGWMPTGETRELLVENLVKGWGIRDSQMVERAEGRLKKCPGLSLLR